MKPLNLLIIIIACIVVASVVWYLATYDPTPVTTENNFGINALVVHSPAYMACPTEDCKQPDYYLKINSKSKVLLEGYNICDENSCVKKDEIEIPLPVSDILHPEYAKLPLPNDLPWKDGDFVNIRVKVSNSSMSGGTLDFSTSNIWVDLANSDIVRSS